MLHYGEVLRLFDYYCAISNNTGKGAHAIQQNSYYQMVKDCNCLGGDLSLEDVQVRAPLRLPACTHHPLIHSQVHAHVHPGYHGRAYSSW